MPQDIPPLAHPLGDRSRRVLPVFRSSLWENDGRFGTKVTREAQKVLRGGKPSRAHVSPTSSEKLRTANVLPKSQMHSIARNSDSRRLAHEADEELKELPVLAQTVIDAKNNTVHAANINVTSHKESLAYQCPPDSQSACSSAGEKIRLRRTQMKVVWRKGTANSEEELERMEAARTRIRSRDRREEDEIRNIIEDALKRKAT